MNSEIDNKQVYVRTKTCLVWNIIGLLLFFLSFMIIFLPEIVISLITIIKRNVKVYSSKENKYLILPKKVWKEYKRINNIGFWKQYSLISVTNIIHQNYSNNQQTQDISVLDDQTKDRDENKESVSPVRMIKPKRDLKDINIDVTQYLNRAIDIKNSKHLKEDNDNRFKLAKTRLADRDSKQAVTHRNKIKLLYSKQQKYDDLQKRIKFENNGEANFGVDFKNRIIFVDRLYESKDFNELSFDDLSDVEIDQQNSSNIGFIRKDGSIIQATFTKFPVSKEEKSLDNIMLKNLALKIKNYLSSPITE